MIKKAPEREEGMNATRVPPGGCPRILSHTPFVTAP
jgi:hypothetical protein